MNQIEKDKQLLKLCIKTNDANPFVKRYYNVIKNTIISMANKRNRWIGEEDLKDLCQVALMDMFKNDWKRLKNYDENRGMSVTSWVVLLTHHAAWSFFGSPEKIDFGEDMEGYAQNFPDVEKIVVEKDKIQKNWPKLKADEKLAFRLKHYLGVPVEKIADMIDRKEVTVFKIVAKAVKKLNEE